MTDHTNIYVALAAAQSEMEAVVKGAVNPAFKSKYATLDDVVQVARPALNRHGIAFFHQPIIGEFGSAMRTVLVHGSSDTRIECDVPLLLGKNDMQGFKSATTYAKRIGLESLTGLAPSDDDDGNAAAASAPKVNAASAGIKDAWENAVLDSLPENATPRQKAEAFADAIAQDFAGKKGAKALDNAWDRHRKWIEALRKHDDLFGRVIDAFETRKNEITEPQAAE